MLEKLSVHFPMPPMFKIQNLIKTLIIHSKLGTKMVDVLIPIMLLLKF
jgi:hypothetical protein